MRSWSTCHVIKSCQTKHLLGSKAVYGTSLFRCREVNCGSKSCLTVLKLYMILVYSNLGGQHWFKKQNYWQFLNRALTQFWNRVHYWSVGVNSGINSCLTEHMPSSEIVHLVCSSVGISSASNRALYPLLKLCTLFKRRIQQCHQQLPTEYQPASEPVHFIQV